VGLAARGLAMTRYSVTQFRQSVARAYRRLAIAAAGNA
jgi:hypothetical protein